MWLPSFCFSSVSSGTDFFTTLLTSDNKEVVIPNGEIIADNIINYSRHTYRRIDLVIDIGYQSHIADVKAVMLTVIERNKRIDRAHGVMVHLGELGAFSLNFYVRVRNADYWDTYFDLLENIKEALDNSAIDIPYPQIDIRVQQLTNILSPALTERIEN